MSPQYTPTPLLTLKWSHFSKVCYRPGHEDGLRYDSSLVLAVSCPLSRISPTSRICMLHDVSIIVFLLQKTIVIDISTLTYPYLP